MKNVFFSIFTALLAFLFFKKAAPTYPQINDVYHPTLKDLRQLQYYLEKGKRPYIGNLKDFQGRSQIKLIGTTNNGLPKAGMIALNCDESEKENCLLLYATFNKNYPEGIKKVIDRLAASDYRGHILYRIGGWPNCEEGDFSLAHVPYAFKVCFFKEAQRLGYKRALWLDTSITPLVSLNAIFSQIAKEGYLAMGNRFMVGPFFNEDSAKFFNLPLEETGSIPSCSSGIFGLDFSNAKANHSLDLWHLAAKDPAAFFSARPDQNSLSLILYQLNMRNWLDIGTLAHGKEQISEHSLFLIERDFVRDQPKRNRIAY